MFKLLRFIIIYHFAFFIFRHYHTETVGKIITPESCHRGGFPLPSCQHHHLRMLFFYLFINRPQIVNGMDVVYRKTGFLQ